MVHNPNHLPDHDNVLWTSRILSWFLVPVFVVIGLLGGAAAGVSGPYLIEGGKHQFDSHFILLFAGFGSLAGILPALIGGILAVVVGYLLPNRGYSLAIQFVLAVGVFCLPVIGAILVVGYLYLASLADC